MTNQRTECENHDVTQPFASNIPGFHYHKRSQRLFCDVCGGSGYGPGGTWMEKHKDHVPCTYPECGAMISAKGLIHHIRMHKDKVVINADPTK